MLPENRKYFAALYMRLSKDDEGKGESASITTQRKMLRLTQPRIIILSMMSMWMTAFRHHL